MMRMSLPSLSLIAIVWAICSSADSAQAQWSYYGSPTGVSPSGYSSVVVSTPYVAYSSPGVYAGYGATSPGTYAAFGYTYSGYPYVTSYANYYGGGYPYSVGYGYRGYGYGGYPYSVGYGGYGGYGYAGYPYSVGYAGYPYGYGGYYGGYGARVVKERYNYGLFGNYNYHFRAHGGGYGHTHYHARYPGWGYGYGYGGYYW